MNGAVVIRRSTPAAAALTFVAIVGGGACDREQSDLPVQREASTRAGTWTLAPRVPKGVAGYQGTSAFAVDGKVVVVAEVDYDQATVKVISYDSADERWTIGTDSRIWWRVGAAVVATDDDIILHGGCCGPAGSGSRATGFAYDVRRDRWRTIDDGPLGDRAGHTGVWTGREVIFWGSSNAASQNDGAAYDPEADTWHLIAGSPLEPRRDHVSVWTGDEMIIWGGITGRDRVRFARDGAAYDPDADRWRPIAPAPIPPQAVAEPGPNVTEAVWTGREMLVWNGLRGAAYDPAADYWRRIGRPPSPPRDPTGTDSAVWTGEELVVWGGVRDGVQFLETGAAFDPKSSQWRLLPESPLKGRDRHASAWTGDAMLIWGGCCQGTRYFNNGAFFRPG